MVSRQKRLHEVFEHLRNFCGIHTQTDFANALKYSRVYVSSALNGNENNLTDKLFESICKVYPNTFNLDYLLTGEGSLLIKNDEEQNAKPPPAQPTVDMLELYAQRIRLVDDLRATLKEELAEVRIVLGELQQARDEFQETTRALKKALFGLGDEPRGFIAADEIHPK